MSLLLALVGGSAPSQSLRAGVEFVSIKPLIKKIKEKYQDRLASIKANRATRRQIKVIEVAAAKLASDDSITDARFNELLAEWSKFEPYIENAPDIDLRSLFMAQIAFRLRQLEQTEQDEEEAIIALLLAA